MGSSKRGVGVEKPVDQRVEALKRAVQDGTYRADPEAIAAAMIKRVQPKH